MYDVIIIGSGFSGIYTLKHCLEEGLKPLVLEKSKHLGGVWNINNKPGGVQEFTYSVTSKLYLSASDFPPPEDWPEFPNASLVYDYLMDYVKHFQLEKYILTGTLVKDVKRIDNRWHVIGENGNAWNSKSVVLATGVNTCPSYPKEPLFSQFTGPSFHAHYYDSSELESFKNKKVLIIGGSDTACDIATHICEVTDKTYVSIRDGQWFQDRIFGAESPADMYYSRTTDWMIKNIFGKKYVHRNFGDNTLSYWWGRGGSDIDIWKPKCDYLNSYYNKSRDIIRMVSKGKITPAGRVKTIEKNMIECEGIDEPFPIDIIIYATGYSYAKCSTFLQSYIHSPRYTNIFPILETSDGNISFDNVAFIGYIRPYLTSIPMMIELQSRYVAKVFANKVRLPSPEKMKLVALKDKAKQQKEFSCQAERIPFLVDPYDYANKIAKAISAKPNYIQIWLQDPFLGYCLMFDSWNHYAYRLHDKDPVKRELATKMIKEYHTHKSSIKIRHTVFQLIGFFTSLIIAVIVLIYFIRRRYM